MVVIKLLKIKMILMSEAHLREEQKLKDQSIFRLTNGASTGYRLNGRSLTAEDGKPEFGLAGEARSHNLVHILVNDPSLSLPAPEEQPCVHISMYVLN